MSISRPPRVVLAFFLLLHLWLPSVTAYPGYVDCATDDKTILKLGTTIMKVPVTKASSAVTLQALRGGKATPSYIEGELLVLELKGFPAGASALVRVSDASNTTLHLENTAGMFTAMCAGQAYVPQSKTLAGSSTTVGFRPGCVSSAMQSQGDELSIRRLANAEPLVLTFVTCTNYGKPVELATLSLTPEGKQDPSCNGGAIPTLPPPPTSSALYTNLVWVHRIAVLCSWGFLFPLGVALVRYYPSGSRMNLHRMVQSAGLLVELVDFTCIYKAHSIGPSGLGPVDAHFSGTAGASPGTTHKQRGLAVFICIVFQLIFGVLRPKPFPNTFVRRIWLWAHRTVGDGAMIVAWVQIWESVSVVTPDSTLTTMTIVGFLFTASAALVAPVYFMLVASKIDREQENDAASMVGSFVSDRPGMHRQVSAENEDSRDAHFFSCGHCSQVFTAKHILELHIRYGHPGMEYAEIVTPMTQRFAETVNNPVVSEGLPLSKVKRHNKQNDCWVVLNGQVYDLTNFLNSHPGGPNPILSWAGRDASRTWNLIHQKSWLDRYPTVECLGPVAPEPPVPTQSESPTNYAHQRGKAVAVLDPAAAPSLSSSAGTSLVPMEQRIEHRDSGFTGN